MIVYLVYPTHFCREMNHNLSFAITEEKYGGNCEYFCTKLDFQVKVKYKNIILRKNGILHIKVNLLSQIHVDPEF